MQRCWNVFLFPFLYKEEQRHAPSGNSVWCTAHHAAYLRPRAKSPLEVITSTTSPHPSNFEEKAPVSIGHRPRGTRADCYPPSVIQWPSRAVAAVLHAASNSDPEVTRTNEGEEAGGAGTLGRWAPWPYFRCHWAPKGPKNPLPASAAAGQTGSKIWRCKMSVSKWT